MRNRLHKYLNLEKLAKNFPCNEKFEISYKIMKNYLKFEKFK